MKDRGITQKNMTIRVTRAQNIRNQNILAENILYIKIG